MKSAFHAFLAILILITVALAQTTQKPRSQKPDPDDTVHIGVQLIQIDVSVTDKSDRPVPDLKPEDFELFEDGKKQEIKFLEYVDAVKGRRSKSRPGAPTVVVEAGEASDVNNQKLGRIFAFVVDDLTIPLQDMTTVRQMLTNFVDHDMLPGDLVAIVRSVGGRSLLEQFTGDKDLLRRAVSLLTSSTHPFAVSAPGAARVNLAAQSPAGATASTNSDTRSFSDISGDVDIQSASDDTNLTLRSLMALSTASFVIDSMRDLPGHKTMVLLSGGLPIFSSRSGQISNVSDLFTRLADNAARSGVVINTMDVRGLSSTPGVVRAADVEGKSALGVQPGGGAGRFGESLDPTVRNTEGQANLNEPMGLTNLASRTGGIAVQNTNNFSAALGRILAHSDGYYLLAYTSTNENWDGKPRKWSIKVKRSGVRVSMREGYLAREDKAGPQNKQNELLEAARSPIARNDINLAVNLLMKAVDSGKTALDIHLLIDVNQLNLTSSDGKDHNFDIAGFVYDEFGKLRGGFAYTFKPTLSPEQLKQADGLSYTASTQLPPGNYQIRIVVRENDTGSLGTLSRYLEIPDLTNGRLAMSSIFLFAADPKDASTPPTPLLALRRLSRKQDLRYATLIYNPKLDKDHKAQLRSQLTISQGDTVIFQEPEQTLDVQGNQQARKLGQLALAKVKPGRYTMTLTITDPLADKKASSVSRRADFIVVD